MPISVSKLREGHMTSVNMPIFFKVVQFNKEIIIDILILARSITVKPLCTPEQPRTHVILGRHQESTKFRRIISKPKEPTQNHNSSPKSPSRDSSHTTVKGSTEILISRETIVKEMSINSTRVVTNYRGMHPCNFNMLMCLSMAKPRLPAEIRDMLFVTCYDASKDRMTEETKLSKIEVAPNKDEDRHKNINPKELFDMPRAYTLPWGRAPLSRSLESLTVWKRSELRHCTLTRAVSTYRKAIKGAEFADFWLLKSSLKFQNNHRSPLQFFSSEE
ncbi:hypothetical protein L1987_46484 [Smallanthus sonchifolius]|uniref:Uncharacterized protein n=1 Tax=Smallanthus sonchifolius TaxID=185202 RepID=A0ACB9G0X2_9ASTR|nr:hypothetical protein L1987_46484 [Smallanthus sonchifolius]